MPKKKDRKVSAERFAKKHVTEETIEGIGNVDVVRPINAVINLPELGSKAGSGKNIDLTPYYGKGYDDIVNRVYYTALSLIQANKVRQSTILNYLGKGFVNLVEYLSVYRQALGHDVTQEAVNRTMINGFMAHIKDREPKIEYTSQKGIYTMVKSLLVATHTHNYWSVTAEACKNTFPSNPYPNSNKRQKGKNPLTEKEKRQVVVALKQALKPIVAAGRTEPLSGYELTMCIFAIAMQTGINTSPLLDMTTDSLGDHPLKENRKLLTVFKHRGNATQLHNLRKSEALEVAQGIKLDVALIIECMMKLNQSLRDELNSDLLAVYRPLKRNGAPKDQITSLTDTTLWSYAVKLVQEYNLTDDDGNPMELNLSRIRKTFINGIYELSGEDLIVTAKAANHAGSSTSDHYLRAPEEKKRNLGIIGEIRVKNLLENDTEKTPMAGCKDTKYGDKAPKNGKTCADFLECFRCKSFVITGDDLYKLFSFYWAVVRNRDSFGRKDWKRHLRNIITIIDEEIEPEFAKRGMLSEVQAERERARQTPHPYWRNLDMLRVGQ